MFFSGLQVVGVSGRTQVIPILATVGSEKECELPVLVYFFIANQTFLDIEETIVSLQPLK